MSSLMTRKIHFLEYLDYCIFEYLDKIIEKNVSLLKPPNINEIFKDN